MDATSEIIAKLKQGHPNLFELLQLTVKKLGKWAKEDIAWNNAEWVQIQHNSRLSTEQPASVTNSLIQFTDVDEIPDVIRETEERLSKKRSHTVHLMLDVVFLTYDKLQYSARTSRLQIANLKKPSFILVNLSPAFSRLNPVTVRRLPIVKSSGYFQTSHTPSLRMRSEWQRTSPPH